MNKIFRHKILAGAMLFGFMLAGSSCQDKEEGIRVTAETPFADKTLYEVIKNDLQLTDFVEVLNACGEHCADSLFNHSRVYTVWAPENGTFNKDSIIAETVPDENGNSNRDIVFRSFIEAHIANHLVAANGALDEENYVLLLNGKNAVFAGNYNIGYTFDGIDVKERNIRVKNGILHKIASPSEYKYSIWEYLKIAENVDSVAKYLYSYNVTEFNEGQSISGPIVNGEQTFIDSVFTTSNIWLDAWRGVGNINNEDSTYVVYVPSNDMWKKMVAKAEAHFNYDLSFKNMSDATKYERDSLRKYYARFNNLKYMTYSVKEQRHVTSSDSMMPAYRGIYKRPLFAVSELEENVIFEKQLSNGIFKVVDAMPYKQTDLWHDTIFLEGENKSMWDMLESTTNNIAISTAYKSQLNRDSMLLGAEVSGGQYLDYPRESGEATVTFKLPKLLAAKYQVAVVFVPKNITNEFVDKEKMYPNRLDIVLKQENDEQSDTLYRAEYVDDTTLAEDPTLVDRALYTDPFKLDTLFLTRDGDTAIIQPRFCEFYDGAAKDYHVSLVINSKIATNKEKRKGMNFDTSIRIDKIILIPILDSEE